MSGKNKRGSLSVPGSSPQIPQDYDLQHALSVIRRGGKNIIEPIESTKTDIRIGSVIVNIPDNSESNSETQTRLTSNFATEQYVESLVNNLRADQKTSNTQLTELFNQKLDVVNNRIDITKEKCLSKVGFWTGISLVIAIIALVIAFLLYDLQKSRTEFDNIRDVVEKQEKRIETINEGMNSLKDSIIVIQEEVKRR